MLLKAIFVLPLIGVIGKIETCDVSVRVCHPCRGSVTTGISDVAVTEENSALVRNLMKEIAHIRAAVNTNLLRIRQQDFDGDVSVANGYNISLLPFVRQHHRITTTSNITRIYDMLSDVILNIRVHYIPYAQENGLFHDWVEPRSAISSAFCYLKKLAQAEGVNIPRRVCRKTLSVNRQPPNRLTFSVWMYAILTDARQQIGQIMNIILTNSF